MLDRTRLAALAIVSALGALASGGCGNRSSAAPALRAAATPVLVVSERDASPPLDAAAAGRAFANPDLSPESRVDDLLAALTLDEKIACLSPNPSLPRLGLRLTGHVEGLHGLALGGPGRWGRDEPIPTTTFPQAVGLAETWDPALVREVARVEGVEARWMFHARQRGGLIVRAPNADLARDPRWGRTEESYGEDPFLAGVMATAFVHGLQGDDPNYWQAASLLKHFVANTN